MKNSPDDYFLTVVFRRSLSDDVEIVAGKSPGLTLDEKLKSQFAAELDEAINTGGVNIPGNFEVTGISYKGEISQKED